MNVRLLDRLSNRSICCVGIPITDPRYWLSEDECTLDTLRHVFRSCTDEEMPMLENRLECLREAGQVLDEVSPLGACHVLTLTDLLIVV